MWEVLLTYLSLGLFAGLIAGLLGVGGGLIIVPVLAASFVVQEFPAAMIMQLAIGTSLATIVVTGISSTRAHHQRGAVQWPWVRRLAPGLVIGAMGGAIAAHFVSSEDLKLVFGVFECIIALYMLIGSPIAKGREITQPTRFELFAIGSSIGAISSFLGIGGGTMTVPYLSWRGMEMRYAIAISAACGLPIAVMGTMSYILVGSHQAGLPAGTSGYIYWPAVAGIAVASLVAAPWGASLAHRLPTSVLKRLFGVILAMIGIAMII